MIRSFPFLLLSIVSFIWVNLFAKNQEIQDQCELDIVTPSLRMRKTAKMRLDNGLEVYLISDPHTDQSAAAICMEVGSWSDPKEAPGMAHFLEHLLFLGSKTYPEENAYSKQVQDNQGTYNAYTAPTHTVYTFSVNNDAFLTTLDLFSHLFSEPLFSAFGVERELYAIDQEHDKNVQNDFYRLWMVLKETGNPNHPNALFSTGNFQTLRGIPREAVKEWYQTHYNSAQAHLVLYSSLPLEDLKMRTLPLFTSLPHSQAPKASMCKEPLFSKSQEGHIIGIEPDQERHTLILKWEMPPEYLQNVSHAAHTLLESIIQNKSSFSLYAQLEKEGLIQDIACQMNRIGKETAYFSIDCTLTPQGAKAFQTVIERCFQTLHFLKTATIPHSLYEDIQTMANINYQFQSRTSPYTFVQTCATDLMYEPLNTYPRHTVLKGDYTPKELASFLELLSPEKGVYIVMAPSTLTNLTPDKKEQWTGAPYTVQPISKQTLKEWSHLLPHPKIALPENNRFVPHHLSLITPLNERTDLLIPVPSKLLETDRGELYFWADSRYHVPEVSWILDIYTPLISQSPCQKVLADLFCLAFNHKMSPILSEATAASLRISGSIDTKLSLHLNGYSEKAKILLLEGLQTLKECKITQEDFDRYVTTLNTQYANNEKERPLNQAFEIYRALFLGTGVSQRDKRAALQTLTYTEFLSFTTHFFDTYYIKGLFAGNMTEKEARQIWENIEETLKGTPYLKKDHTDVDKLIVPPFKGPFKICIQTNRLGNAACLILQQGEMTFEKAASHLICTTVLKEDFFNTLRTKQQTGYIVGVKGDIEPQTDLHHLLFVQSSTHQPEELLARFELFLETYVKEFEQTLPEGRFELIKKNLITYFETPITRLDQMARRLHQIAFEYHGNFTILDTLITALKEIQYDDLKKDAAAFFSRNNVKRVAVLIEGKQPEEKQFRYQEITEKDLREACGMGSNPTLLKPFHVTHQIHGHNKGDKIP